MKNLKTIALSIVALVSLTAQGQSKKIDTEKSSINWVGKKVTGQHEGTINLKEGVLIFKDQKVAGGNFVVDMTSINTTDLSGDGKKSLDGHLKSADFFGTEKFETATLKFQKIGTRKDGTYQITADLTIKGITNPVVFDMVVKENMATAQVMVNRTKYDIKYGSGSFFDNLGDKTIDDEFELNVKLAL